jgi:hypothetical protein
MTRHAAALVTRVAQPWSVRLGGATRHHLLTVSLAFMPCTMTFDHTPDAKDR